MRNSIILKNRDEFIKSLSYYIVKNELSVETDIVDIYFYFNESGDWIIKEYRNPGGKNFYCDGGTLIWRVSPRTRDFDFDFWKSRSEEIENRYIDYFRKSIEKEIFEDVLGVSVIWV